MVNHKLLGLSAMLVLIGEVLVTIIVLFLHPEGGNTVEDTLANYAASSDWAAIHLGQFVGMAAIIGPLPASNFCAIIARVPLPLPSQASGRLIQQIWG